MPLSYVAIVVWLLFALITTRVFADETQEQTTAQQLLEQAVPVWKRFDERASNQRVIGRRRFGARINCWEFKKRGQALSVTSSPEIKGEHSTDEMLALPGTRISCTDGYFSFLIERTADSYHVFAGDAPRAAVTESMAGGEYECRAPWSIQEMSLADSLTDPQFHAIAVSSHNIAGDELVKLDYKYLPEDPDGLTQTGWIGLDKQHNWLVRCGEVTFFDLRLKREFKATFEIAYDDLAADFPRPLKVAWKRELAGKIYYSDFTYEKFETDTCSSAEFSPVFYGLPDYSAPRNKPTRLGRYTVVAIAAAIALTLLAWTCRRGPAANSASVSPRPV